MNKGAILSALLMPNDRYVREISNYHSQDKQLHTQEKGKLGPIALTTVGRTPRLSAPSVVGLKGWAPGSEAADISRSVGRGGREAERRDG